MFAYSPATLTKPQVPRGCIGKVWDYRNKGHQGFLHYHAEVEVNVVLEGSARCIVGNRTYPLTPGTLIWMPSRRRHLLFDKSPDLRMWIAIALPGPLGIRELSRSAPSADEPPLCKRVSLRTLTHISSLMREIAATPEPAGLFNAGLVYALWKTWDAHRREARAPENSALHSAVQKAIALMQKDPDGLPIPELARRAGLSPSRFTEVFNRDTGMTPVEFRNRQRIEKFLRLRCGRNPPTMLAAAYLSGFGSYPQFFRTFSRIMSCSPAHYRREHAHEAPLLP
jgi:AraC-like DNA-binding protein